MHAGAGIEYNIISCTVNTGHEIIFAATVNSAYNELLGAILNSSLYPEFVITV